MNWARDWRSAGFSWSAAISSKYFRAAARSPARQEARPSISRAECRHGLPVDARLPIRVLRFGNARRIDRATRPEAGQDPAPSRRIADIGDGVELGDRSVAVTGSCLLRGRPELGEKRILPAAIRGDCVQGLDCGLVVAFGGNIERRDETVAGRLRLMPAPIFPEAPPGRRYDDQDRSGDDIGPEPVPEPLVAFVAKVLVDLAEDIGH